MKINFQIKYMILYSMNFEIKEYVERANAPKLGSVNGAEDLENFNLIETWYLPRVDKEYFVPNSKSSGVQGVFQETLCA